MNLNKAKLNAFKVGRYLLALAHATEFNHYIQQTIARRVESFYSYTANMLEKYSS